MSSKIRSCVNRLRGEKDGRELLPEYVEQSMQLYDGYARIKMMMEYYMFYEVAAGGINPYMEMAQETIQLLNQLVGEVFAAENTEKQISRWKETLLHLRQEIMDRMQVITGYVDCFLVYEYILNRIQYRFEEQKAMMEDAEFAQEILNVIFSSQDNAVVQDYIHTVVGQLPMRMTRKHYFDLLRDGISIYKGSDWSSLEGFLYMIRTSAMLYRDPGQEKYFTGFVAVLEEMAQVDYEKLDRAGYGIYAEKIKVNASKLNDLSDLYMQIGQLVNDLYMIVTAMEFRGDVEPMTQADDVMKGIHSLFTGADSPVWNQAEEIPETEEDKIMWLGEKLAFAEGKQENLYESVALSEAALEEIRVSHAQSIDALGLQPAFAALHELSMLNSDSIFAPLQEQAEEIKVTPEMAEEEAEKLIGELKELFEGRGRLFRRAIMAVTVEKLPVLFTSAQEVADYVINSLRQCDDSAEKYASEQLIWDLTH